MIDVQSQADDRNIPIQKVGVKNLRYPITVLDRKNGSQHTNASVDLYADLPSHFKGTHMSRFIEVFNRYYRDLTMNKFVAMMRDLREALEAQRSFAEVVFPYFIEKAAPVSGQRSMMSYVCRFSGESSETEDLFFAGVEVPVATVCPCSREISDRAPTTSGDS
jgi:GTP cyclohydrolase I